MPAGYELIRGNVLIFIAPENTDTNVDAIELRRAINAMPQGAFVVVCWREGHGLQCLRGGEFLRSDRIE